MKQQKIEIAYYRLGQIALDISTFLNLCTKEEKQTLTYQLAVAKLDGLKKGLEILEDLRN